MLVRKTHTDTVKLHHGVFFFLASIQIFSNTSFLFGKRPVSFQVLFSFPSKTQNAYHFVSIKRCWEAVQLLLEI